MAVDYHLRTDGGPVVRRTDRARGGRRPERLRASRWRAVRAGWREPRPHDQRPDREGARGRRRRRVHGRLASRIDPALRQGRRDLAGPLRHGHMGRGVPHRPRRRRSGRQEGLERRGRVLGVHDAGSDDGGDGADRARRAPPRPRRDASGRLRARDRLLRELDGARRDQGGLPCPGALRRDPRGGSPAGGRRAGDRGGRARGRRERPVP